MHAEIFAIGTELLMGELMDANSAWLAARLPALGIELRRVSLLGDHLPTLSDAMAQALQGVDLIITTGGLGPTQDDLTREAMAAAFRILGEGQLSLTKFLLVLDRAVDLHDFPAVLQALLARTHPETDLFVFSNVSMDTLDYTGPRVNEGSKGVWLGLGDPVRELPRASGPAGDLPSGLRDPLLLCALCPSRLPVARPNRSPSHVADMLTACSGASSARPASSTHTFLGSLCRSPNHVAKAVSAASRPTPMRITPSRIEAETPGAS